MKRPNQVVYDKLTSLYNVPELKDLKIWYWMPSSSVGDYKTFMIYRKTSGDSLEADDATYMRRYQWTILFYTRDYGLDISEDLESAFGVPIDLDSSYIDDTSGHLVYSYRFTF